jgi:MOSC domain-containing protein YiiM
MQVLSVNISLPQTIIVNGKEEKTGYFKTPVKSIFLKENGVENDSVVDKIHHGGVDKACYLFGYNHYPYWQKQYPNLEFNFGMFGENITVEKLDESALRIGDTFQLGKAIIQITQPRQPCYKMGIKFNNPNMVNDFRLAHTSGVYVKVLKEGAVKEKDKLQLVKRLDTAPTVLEVYRLIYSENPKKEQLLQVVDNPYIANRLKNYIIKKFKL